MWVESTDEYCYAVLVCSVLAMMQPSTSWVARWHKQGQPLKVTLRDSLTPSSSQLVCVHASSHIPVAGVACSMFDCRQQAARPVRYASSGQTTETARRLVSVARLSFYSRVPYNCTIV